MAVVTPPPGVAAVLRAGGRLFAAGLGSTFFWVLAAELVTLLPFAPPGGGILDMDLGLLLQPNYLLRLLLCSGLQAVFYSCAVLGLARLAGNPAAASHGWLALRTAPGIFVGYLVYQLAVGIGLLLTFAVFMLGSFIAGPLTGLLLCILPLAPTAAASTALAFFIFPVVLERRGPFVALSESSRLAKTAWLRVSLVISVPALALLAAWFVGEASGLYHQAADILDLMRRSGTDGQADSLSALSAAITPAEANPRYGFWPVVGTLLGAFAWWYTLAVCYAQYRALKVSENA